AGVVRLRHVRGLQQSREGITFCGPDGNSFTHTLDNAAALPGNRFGIYRGVEPQDEDLFFVYGAGCVGTQIRDCRRASIEFIVQFARQRLATKGPKLRVCSCLTPNACPHGRIKFVSPAPVVQPSTGTRGHWALTLQKQRRLDGVIAKSSDRLPKTELYRFDC